MSTIEESNDGGFFYQKLQRAMKSIYKVLRLDRGPSSSLETTLLFDV